ncbi:alpha-crystallin domain-containing protein 22.3-like isoform X2 [Alnus glutinosa]|uniref:alpha-crystallin domain-containing protein 22.3-like isoform X2 n=1 Tax=Alnus glutinosa TaxID=3517 RepID=UPI002D78B2ED|nr:alpha-crystallin domain-containing protein 22.3-like isoform X2 [Alnus glutinosa]
MASPLKGGRSRKENNGPEPINPQQAILDVAPLNSVPYIGPPTPHSYTASLPTKRYTETLEKVGPAMIFLPTLSTKEEWNNVVAATRVGVALTGSAAMGKIGPVIGLMDIGESKDSYFFRVSLPGVARDENGFHCDVEPDGKVVIKGVTTTGEKIVCKNSQIFQMHTQNLCPPGHFSISFQLPGPVDQQQFSGSFGIDGILEGVVKKR